MADALTVRPVTPADLTSVVRLHRLAFQGFFLDRMGPAFLKQYYASVLAYPGSLSLLAEREGQAVAFAVGFLDPSGFYAHFRARRLQMMPALFLGLLRSPGLLREVIRNAGRMERAEMSDKETAELSSIGVATRGGGVGSLLLLAFCQGMFDRGARRVVLSTDEANNDATRGFYEARGFRMTSVEERGARTLCWYELMR